MGLSNSHHLDLVVFQTALSNDQRLNLCYSYARYTFTDYMMDEMGKGMAGGWDRKRLESSPCLTRLLYHQLRIPPLPPSDTVAMDSKKRDYLFIFPFGMEEVRNPRYTSTV